MASQISPDTWNAFLGMFAEKTSQYATPGELARRLDPRTIQTPALDLVDRALVDLAEKRTKRLIISISPQEGKSLRISRVFPLWMLLRNPDLRIAISSYEATMAHRWGRAIRSDIKAHPELGLKISSDRSAAYDWALEGSEGTVYCVGVGGALTSRAVDLMIIDDPHKGHKEADSPTQRDDAWEWWTGTVRTRFSPETPIVLIMCMTGDTPVLLADGTERALRDVRPGDAVATYENGRLATSVVRNWANQGPDTLYEIRMKSGVTVRANARHPFLTIENGIQTWQRTDMLRPGSRILRATGASGAVSPAPKMAVMPPRGARACACPTTTRVAGQPVSGRPLSTPSPAASLASSTATALRRRSTTACAPSSTDSVRSAGSRRPTRTPAPTGPENSASTTTMKPVGCVACSATTATSWSDTDKHPNGSARPLATWSVTPDEVVEVVPAGVEDVFDLQVDRTENFIANGLVSHNTRWHEDDLAGRMIRDDPASWTVINIPARADHRPERGETDPLGREPGQFLVSTRGRHLMRPAGSCTKHPDRECCDWEDIESDVGSRTWSALYQGRPTPGEGLIFRREWWQYYSTPQWIVQDDGTCLTLTFDEVVQSWDMTFKDTDSSDFVVGQVWGRRGPDAYLLDQVRGRMSFVETCMQVRSLSAKWPTAVAKLVEDKANGPAVLSSLRLTVSGLVAVEPEGSKLARASAVSPFVEAKNVWLPDFAPFTPSLIDECASFPLSANDDMVDALSQALSRLLLHAIRPRVTVL